MNGTRGLPPPRTALPTLRTQLPSSLQQRFAPVLQRQPNLAAAAALARQPDLATSELSRSLAGPDPTRDLANRIRLSIAQKKEQMPGLSQSRKSIVYPIAKVDLLSFCRAIGCNSGEASHLAADGQRHAPERVSPDE